MFRSIPNLERLRAHTFLWISCVCYVPHKGMLLNMLSKFNQQIGCNTISLHFKNRFNWNNLNQLVWQYIFLQQHRFFNLLRKSSNKIRLGKWRMLCSPKFDYVFLGELPFIISGPTIFDFPTTIFDHYHNKIVSAQQNTHCIQILYVVPPKFHTLCNCFSEGNFNLCIENVTRVSEPFFLHIKSWCTSSLHEIDFRCLICHKMFFT